MALQIGLGNMGGAMSANFYRAQDSPKFILGHSLEMGFITMGLVATFAQRAIYAMINRNRERQEQQGLRLSDNELSDLGDRAPTFRYNL